MTSRHPTLRRHRRSLRGAASLAVTLIMLALAALVVLYTNRGQLFEQRTSANQSRATSAFEVAEAGIEWATAKLNSSTEILPSSTNTCIVPSANASARTFRDLYAPSTTLDPTNPTLFDFTPPLDSRAACSMNEITGAQTCRCPVPGQTPVISTPGTHSFTVTFSDVPTDPGAVQVTSVGCLNNAALCNETNARNSDATATVTVLLKFVPGAGSVPNAALNVGGNARVCSAFNIENVDHNSGGILINSGADTQVGNIYQSASNPVPGCGGSPTLTTLPGTPAFAAIVTNDPALAAAAAAVSSDSIFFAYFGMTIEQYKAPPTCIITGGSTQLLAEYGRTTNPCNRFWIEGDIAFSGNQTLGAPATNTDPGRQIMMASAGAMRFNGTFDIYGIIYSDSQDWNALGTGSSVIHGAVITRGDYRNNGNGSIRYDPSALRGLTKSTGQFVRIPGSWRDFTP